MKLHKNSTSFLERLDRLKAANAESDEQVGRRIGYSRSYIAKVKKGEVEPSIKAMHNLAEAERAAGLEPPFDAHLRRIRTVTRLAESDDARDQHIEDLGTMESELYGWKSRALAAERELEQLKATLQSVVEGIKSPTRFRADFDVVNMRYDETGRIAVEKEKLEP